MGDSPPGGLSGHGEDVGVCGSGLTGKIPVFQIQLPMSITIGRILAGSDDLDECKQQIGEAAKSVGKALSDTGQMIFPSNHIEGMDLMAAGMNWTNWGIAVERDPPRWDYSFPAPCVPYRGPRVDGATEAAAEVVPAMIVNFERWWASTLDGSKHALMFETAWQWCLHRFVQSMVAVYCGLGRPDPATAEAILGAAKYVKRHIFDLERVIADAEG